MDQSRASGRTALGAGLKFRADGCTVNVFLLNAGLSGYPYPIAVRMGTEKGVCSERMCGSEKYRPCLRIVVSAARERAARIIEADFFDGGNAARLRIGRGKGLRHGRGGSVPLFRAKRGGTGLPLKRRAAVTCFINRLPNDL